MHLDGEGQIGIRWQGNSFKGIVSTDAAGIIACLLAFPSLSWDDPTGRMTNAFHRLREFALDHPDRCPDYPPRHRLSGRQRKEAMWRLPTTVDNMRLATRVYT
ncbi:antirestriction protein [Aureimonas psammosilenae]|uniref:antirestriction protein n=1 Tax=Aureimonas psammosilenae TaxID=2495496 RepID=UPI0038B28A34